MYRIVCVGGADPQSPCDRVTMASGFVSATAAGDTLARWAEHHFPDARYDGVGGCWRVRDESRRIHCVLVEKVEPKRLAAEAETAVA